MATPKEIEMEAKSLLLKADFLLLLNHFGLDYSHAGISQTNNYFIDARGKLEAMAYETGATLRVREKKGTHELQFKHPQADGSVPEYCDMLSPERLDDLTEFGRMLAGDVCTKLEELGITEPFWPAGTLRTLRFAAQIDGVPDATVYLDESFCFGFIDYEIEVESDRSQTHAKEVLDIILQPLQVRYDPAPKKIQRFFQYKKLA